MNTNTKRKIQEALKQFMTEGDANACNVFKGYDVASGKDGWHYTPFGGIAVYLGKSEGEALETIEDIANSRESA